MTEGTPHWEYGQVGLGSTQIIHLLGKPWDGPEYDARGRNIALCGRHVSRKRKTAPHPKYVCLDCERKAKVIEEHLIAEELELRVPKDEPQPEPVAVAPVPAAEFRPPHPKPPKRLVDASPFDLDYEMTTVPLGTLFVDPDLQRPEQEPWSRKIAMNFSPQRFSQHPPKISERSQKERGPHGERYHIMDGQHEVEAARRAGFAPDTMVPVHLYRGLNRQQEAEKFLHINIDRRVVRQLARFPVAVVAGDALAVSTNEILEKYGWAAKSSGAEGGIACIVQLQRLAAQSPALLDKVMATITGAWGVRAGIQGPIVSGLGMIYAKARSEGLPCEVSQQHMTHRLKTISPEAVLAASKSVGLGTAAARAANYIIAQYNKGLRKTPRLDLFS
jgi:hypothetical protein